MTTFVHEGDLPADALANASSVAIDSETMGLRLGRDPLCVVQLSPIFFWLFSSILSSCVRLSCCMIASPCCMMRWLASLRWSSL